jgi:hypothetical protein
VQCVYLPGLRQVVNPRDRASYHDVCLYVCCRELLLLHGCTEASALTAALCYAVAAAVRS